VGVNLGYVKPLDCSRNWTLLALFSSFYGLNYLTLTVLEQSQSQRNIVGATNSRGKAMKWFWIWEEWLESPHPTP